MLAGCPKAMSDAHAYSKIGLKRKECANLEKFRFVYWWRAQCCFCLRQMAHEPNREECWFSNRLLKTAGIIACCYTTRTPLSGSKLFTGVAGNTFQMR
jgi:hypothetical protein